MEPLADEIIPLAGVIGQPVAHSKSPRLHGHWLKSYGLRGHYVPLDVAPENLAEALKTLPKLGFRGVNVTIPHKEAVVALADEVSDLARRMGAANALTFGPDGRLHADNTDGHGFLAHLRQSAPDWRPEAAPAAVLGAGGASRAIVATLLDAGAPELRLANRTRARAESFVAAFGDKVKVYDWAQASAMTEGCGVIVNTTSIGMNDVGGSPVSLEHAGEGTVVYDIVYKPLETALLREAKARGCVTVDGLGMLLHQAAPAFERWFGRRPVVDDELRQLMLAE